jgi:N-acetylmuramoyl-L-alanine amidase
MTTSYGSLYKYAYGLTSDYNTAKEDLKVVKSKGYTSAYIIAIKDGKNISIQEALK